MQEFRDKDMVYRDSQGVERLIPNNVPLDEFISCKPHIDKEVIKHCVPKT
jgi:hypothetical protein